MLGERVGSSTPPHTMPSSSERGTCVLSSRALVATPASAMVSSNMNSPKARTKGVRTPPMMTARRPLGISPVVLRIFFPDEAGFFLAAKDSPKAAPAVAADGKTPAPAIEKKS